MRIGFIVILEGFIGPSRTMGGIILVYKNSAMPHILWELQGEQHFNNVTNNLKLEIQASITQRVRSICWDITNYMVFMSEPGQQKRRQIGYYVLAFLFLLLILTINLKKEYWKNIK